jgi:hypothetical protein
MPSVLVASIVMCVYGAAAGDVVLAAGAPLDPGLVEPAAGGDVGLGADDRLDPVRPRLLPEVEGAEDVAVVGHGQRRHAELGGLGEQVVEPGRAVEHRVLGVHVQVHERVLITHGGHASLRLGAAHNAATASGDDQRRSEGKAGRAGAVEDCATPVRQDREGRLSASRRADR